MKRALLVCASVATLAGCDPRTPEPSAANDKKPAAVASATASAAVTAQAAPVAPTPPPRKVPGRPTATVAAAPDDPIKAQWSLADATKGLSGSGALTATLETDMGALSCKLYEDKAPVTVANFVGLARGTRPWKSPAGKWEKKPAYDGTTFHRIIKGFMIQGGDAKGTGTGEPGYVIPDEIWADGVHDRAGLLCMANRGPNTNGAQFFITDASAPHLDNNYTIFGECSPEEVVHKIASADVRGDRAASPPKIKSVKISRAK